MIDLKKKLAREAASKAMQVRALYKRSLIDPICPFDLALDMKIELRFQSLPSLEGMYTPTPRSAIVIGSERPAPRQAYTCAHEIGHHAFGHGTKIDELQDVGIITKPFDPEEFLAQTFAGFLLMPKMAIDRALKDRGFTTQSAKATDYYQLACFFGVGYTSFIRHLTYSLRILPQIIADPLLKEPLSDIRSRFESPDITKSLLVVDLRWKEKTVDLEVGDLLLAPRGTTNEGTSLLIGKETNNGIYFEALKQGNDRLSAGAWSCFARIRPKKFEGRAIYRHFPEVADE